MAIRTLMWRAMPLMNSADHKYFANKISKQQQREQMLIKVRTLQATITARMPTEMRMLPLHEEEVEVGNDKKENVFQLHGRT